MPLLTDSATLRRDMSGYPGNAFFLQCGCSAASVECSRPTKEREFERDNARVRVLLCDELCHQPSSLHSRRAPASTAHGIDCQGRRATASTVPQLNVNIVQNIALSSKKLPDSTSNTQEEHVKARRRPGVGATHPRSVRAACWMPPNSIARKR
jgi:hypothetical protein